MISNRILVVHLHAADDVAGIEGRAKIGELDFSFKSRGIPRRQQRVERVPFFAVDEQIVIGAQPILAAAAPSPSASGCL